MTLPFSTIPARFRFASFLVPDGDLREGRNTIVHEYPDRGARYAEDNGRIDSKFRVKGLIGGPGAQAAMRALRAALTQPGPGTLHHPHFGVVRCAVEKEYTLSFSDREFGFYEFDIPFVKTEDAGLTSPAPVAGSSLFGLAREAIAQLIASVSEDHMQGSGFSVEAATILVEATRTVINSVPSASETRNIANRRGFIPLSSIGLAQNRMETEPEAVYRLFPDALGALFDELDVLPAELDEALTGALETAQAVILPEANKTQNGQARLANAEIALGFIRGVVGLHRAELSAAIEFETAEDVADRVASLEDLRNAGLERATQPKARAAVRTAHNAAVNYLTDLELQLPAIADFDVVELPVSVLAYRLYDDVSQQSRLIGLNELEPPALYDGTVSILRHG